MATTIDKTFGMATDLRWLSYMRTATLVMIERWQSASKGNNKDYVMQTEDMARDFLAHTMDLEDEMTNKYGCDQRFVMGLAITVHGENCINTLLKIA